MTHSISKGLPDQAATRPQGAGATSYMVATSNHRALMYVPRRRLALIPSTQPGLPGCESVWVIARPDLGGTDSLRQHGHNEGLAQTPKATSKK